MFIYFVKADSKATQIWVALQWNTTKAFRWESWLTLTRISPLWENAVNSFDIQNHSWKIPHAKIVFEKHKHTEQGSMPHSMPNAPFSVSFNMNLVCSSASHTLCNLSAHVYTVGGRLLCRSSHKLVTPTNDKDTAYDYSGDLIVRNI